MVNLTKKRNISQLEEKPISSTAQAIVYDPNAADGNRVSRGPLLPLPDSPEVSYVVKKHMIQMSITHPSPAALVAVTGTGDKDLDPASGGFVDIQSEYSTTYQYGDTFTVLGNGRVLVNTSCQLKVGGYLDCSHSANNSHIAVTFALVRGGVTTLSSRAVHSKVPNTGDIANIAGGGFLEALAGDEIHFTGASDNTGDISLRSSSIFYETDVLEVV